MSATAGPSTPNTTVHRRVRLDVRGTVQGVGFRPFVYRLARDLGLAGQVRNTPAGVVIEVEGPAGAIDTFGRRLLADKPQLASIDDCHRRVLPVRHDTGFAITDSATTGRRQALVLPDVATCAECRAEIFDPRNRRFRYPFTNCTNCGPRYSIMQGLPYDRPNTTMARFTMCADCRREYGDPLDRRFHAQPNACPACGPQVELWDAAGTVLASRQAAMDSAVRALEDGLIIAVKGLGGFHLLVDPCDDRVVGELRRRKHRDEKPLALMYPSLKSIGEDCIVPRPAADILQSPAAPIVLLDRRPAVHTIAASVAPGCPTLGVMLPYTPLHHLLMAALGRPMVATSGNLSDEPMCYDEHEARARLGDIADLFLVHDRPIHRHVDDSVVHVVRDRPVMLRRARGYAPLPVVTTAGDHPTVLAVGGQLKNTIALATAGRVLVSQHLGDLDTVPAQDAFIHTATALAELYDTAPALIACDRHPDYVSTRFADGQDRSVERVQHHHAHVVACMAEHGLHDPVCGIAWDGTGYGADGTVWGGEVLMCTRCEFERRAHLRAFRLPGGDRAAIEPRRAAFGLLYELFGPRTAHRVDLPCVWSFTAQQRTTLLTALQRGINAPWTSSAGRLFDAVAALLGLQQTATYEGQAAMAVEHCAAASRSSGLYRTRIHDPRGRSGPAILDWAPLIDGILRDLRAGVRRADIAARFHNTLIGMIVAIARRTGLRDVVLSGGCFNNRRLLGGAIDALGQAGFTVYWPEQLPAGDGGLAVGQAVIAVARQQARQTLEHVSCAWRSPAES